MLKVSHYHPCLHLVHLYCLDAGSAFVAPQRHPSRSSAQGRYHLLSFPHVTSHVSDASCALQASLLTKITRILPIEGVFSTAMTVWRRRASVNWSAACVLVNFSNMVWLSDVLNAILFSA